MSQSSELRVESSELKPVRCGCGGEAKVEPLPFEIWNDIWDASVSQYLVRCDRCGMTTRLHDTEAEAVQAWNRAMGKRTVKVELNPLAEDIVIGNTTFKIGTHVIAECECGTWLRLGYKYCPNCGARLEWDE